METRIAPTDTPEALKEAAQRAADLLRAGECVALPTETVYGLAADALNPAAVAKVFEAKERPSFDPLIVHLSQRDDLARVAAVEADVNRAVTRLIESFWPGPLTILLPKTDAVPDIVTSGLPTVAARMSADPVFGRIAKAFGGPLAAPSANRFGRISPTSAAAVMDELGGRIPLIVDGGASHHGLESTIIAIEPAGTASKPTITIHRDGPVTEEDLRKFGRVQRRARDAGDPVRAPGELASHYAPATPLRLLESPDQFHPESGRRYALLSFRGRAKDGFMKLADWDHVVALSPGSGKLPEAAVRLFFALRQLDGAGVDEIIAEPVPERGIGVAIMDRLRKASRRP